MKKLLVLFATLLFSLNVFAVENTNNCLAPTNLMTAADCVIRTSLFGYDIITMVFLVCLLFIMAKKRVSLSVAAPAFFCFISIFIAANILSNAIVYSAVFFYLLIILAVIAGIAMLRFFT